MKKIMIVGEFTAPYRVEVFEGLSRHWESKVYFELFQDEKRNKDWLSHAKINYHIISSKAGRKEFFKDVKKIKKFDAIILYNNSLKYSILLEIICKVLKIPFFLNCDGCSDIVEKNIIKKMAKLFLMKGAQGYFAGSNSAVEYYKFFGINEDEISIHEFTSLHSEDIRKEIISREEKQRVKNRINMKKRFNVVTVGRHIDCKGFDIVLEAAKMIGEEVDFYIIGGEPSESSLKFKNDNNLDNVHFIDFLEKDCLKEYYDAADVFVLMTRGDTWGLVINEAMANGLPVITTKSCVAGVELIKNELNGYIIDVDDTVNLVDKINLLRGNEKLREKMSEANIDRIKNYTIENIIKSHIEVLETFFRKEKRRKEGGK